MSQQLVNSFRVEVDGTPLADEVDRLLTSVVVDNSLVDPDMFVLGFRDPDRVVLDKTGIGIGSAIRLSAVSDAHPGGEELMTGEVTALEAEFSTAGTSTVVRGFDASHRLFRGRSTVAYRNVTYSDVVRTVARRAGVAVGRVDSTSGVHDQVVQANVSDWDLLRRLAAEVGYELAVSSGRLDFRKPGQASEGPAMGNLSSTNGLQLVKGKNLLEFQGVITAADQVADVEVRGWDPVAKQEVVGQASASTSSSAAGLTPAVIAGRFGGPRLVSASTLHDRQADAAAEAKAIAEHVGATSAEFHAVVRGDPRLRAGVAVSLALVGEPFDGKYRVTSSRHVYDSIDGYTTRLSVSGHQGRSLLDLTSGGLAAADAVGRIEGVVPALVTNVNDPDERCRVKVKFPWLSANFESDWISTVQPGAGGQRGAVVLPEVNDEVLVAFDQGDLRRPYVIGGLHNGVDKPKVGTGLVDAGGKVARRGFVSRAGHALVFFDGSGKEGVALMTGDKGLRISLNKTGMAIKITSSGAVEITGSKEVKVEAGTSMTLKAGTTMNIEAGAKLELKGATVAVNGSGPVQVKGTPIQLN